MVAYCSTIKVETVSQFAAKILQKMHDRVGVVCARQRLRLRNANIHLR